MDKWSENIFDTAKNTFEEYLNETNVNLKQVDIVKPDTNVSEFNKCEICDKIFVDKFQWECKALDKFDLLKKN